jgi:hypothetical protein
MLGCWPDAVRAPGSGQRRCLPSAYTCRAAGRFRTLRGCSPPGSQAAVTRGQGGQAGLAAITLKSLLATVVLGLTVVQVLLALWLYRKLPLAGSPPRPVRLSHRLIGFGLFALTVPIAVHCLLAYGVQLTSTRVAVHSLAGCVLYGAFTAKVLLVHSRRLPGWALPAAGGLLAFLVVVLWYTSALWYYNGYQLPGL